MHVRMAGNQQLVTFVRLILRSNVKLEELEIESAECQE